MTVHGGFRKRGLNRAMLAQSLGQISTQLTCKAESAGGKLVKVSPHHMTQTFRACGERPAESIGLSGPTFRCANCGHAEGWEVNAAKSIRATGLAVLGWQGLLPACRAEAAPAAERKPLNKVAVWPMPTFSHDVESQSCSTILCESLLLLVNNRSSSQVVGCESIRRFLAEPIAICFIPAFEVLLRLSPMHFAPSFAQKLPLLLLLVFVGLPLTNSARGQLTVLVHAGTSHSTLVRNPASLPGRVPESEFGYRIGYRAGVSALMQLAPNIG